MKARPDNTLSAKEAALIAQARAQFGGRPAAPAAPAFASTRAAADPPPGSAAPAAVAPAAVADPATDPAQRVAALLAAARAESERLRQRQRRLFVWVPVAFVSVVCLWTLLWLWHRV